MLDLIGLYFPPLSKIFFKLSCPRTCYEENSKLSKRATSFGYGERSDFTKTYTSSPPVTKYNPETLMFMTRKPSNGKTFGISR